MVYIHRSEYVESGNDDPGVGEHLDTFNSCIAIDYTDAISLLIEIGIYLSPISLQFE